MIPALGPVGFVSDGPMHLGTEQVLRRPCAEQTQRTIDEVLSRVSDRREPAGATGHTASAPR
jgi:hypothetical protein